MERRGAERRRIGLEYSPVLALFAEDIDLREEAVIACKTVDPGRSGEEIDAGRAVDGAAEIFGDDVEAVGAEGAAARRNGPVIEEIGVSEPDVLRVFRSASVATVEVPAFGLGRKGGHGATHRQIAEDAGGGSARDFDAVEDVWRKAGPVNPAAERVVHWDAVEENKRAACSGTADAAQRDSLRGGISDHARVPAEQAKAGNLPQAVIEIDTGSLFELIAREFRNVGGSLGGNVFGDGDGSADGFSRGGRRRRGRAGLGKYRENVKAQE